RLRVRPAAIVGLNLGTVDKFVKGFLDLLGTGAGNGRRLTPGGCGGAWENGRGREADPAPLVAPAGAPGAGGSATAPQALPPAAPWLARSWWTGAAPPCARGGQGGGRGPARRRRRVDGTRGLVDLARSARRAGLAVEPRAEAREGLAALLAGHALGARELVADLGDACRGQTVVALELVEVGAREREARRPGELLLLLRVELAETDRLRGVDLVLREELAGCQLEDVQPACDLGAVDVAVVPVGGPGAGADELRRVH